MRYTFELKRGRDDRFRLTKLSFPTTHFASATGADGRAAIANLAACGLKLAL